MVVASSYEDRIALIRKIALRKKKMEMVKAQTRSISKTLAKPARKEQALPDDNKNINAYTDASKYAKQYYGETHFETTRYDNDWD